MTRVKTSVEIMNLEPLEACFTPSLVAQACNPSYSGVQGKRIKQQSSLGNSARLSLKIHSEKRVQDIAQCTRLNKYQIMKASLNIVCENFCVQSVGISSVGAHLVPGGPCGCSGAWHSFVEKFCELLLLWPSLCTKNSYKWLITAQGTWTNNDLLKLQLSISSKGQFRGRTDKIYLSVLTRQRKQSVMQSENMLTK